MQALTHQSAKPSHYNKEAEHYDAFNQQTSANINQLIEKILKQHKVKTVFDLTCGTGSQVFWLHKRGYQAVGYDINTKMLNIAKAKAKQQKLALKFIKGDMRTTKAGQFDALLTIFNAIGHLTKSDFNKTIKNIHANLNPNGLYIFDIFNLNYLLKDDNITKLTIDWQTKSGNTTAREIQYSTIDKNGILTSYDIYFEQTGRQKSKTSTAAQTLQVYSAKQLKQLLEKNGFKVLRQCNIDGSRLSDSKTERIMTIAKKNLCPKLINHAMILILLVPSQRLAANSARPGREQR